jgi:hypothetical protein
MDFSDLLPNLAGRGNQVQEEEYQRDHRREREAILSIDQYGRGFRNIQPRKIQHVLQEQGCRNAPHRKIAACGNIFSMSRNLYFFAERRRRRRLGRSSARAPCTMSRSSRWGWRQRAGHHQPPIIHFLGTAGFATVPKSLYGSKTVAGGGSRTCLDCCLRPLWWP